MRSAVKHSWCYSFSTCQTWINYMYIQYLCLYIFETSITNKFSLVLFLQLTITSPTPVHNWRLPPLVHWPQAFDAVEGKQLVPPSDERISTTAALGEAPSREFPHIDCEKSTAGRSLRIHTKISWGVWAFMGAGPELRNSEQKLRPWDLWEDIVLEQKCSKTVQWYSTFNFQPLLLLETRILLIHMLNPRTWGTRRRCDSLAEWVEVPK